MHTHCKAAWMEEIGKAAHHGGEMLLALQNTVLKTVWSRSLLESGMIQIAPVPAETLLRGTNWPQHASCSVLYRKGVSLFEVKGVPQGNASTSKKSLGTRVACGVNARAGRTATHLTEPK